MAGWWTLVWTVEAIFWVSIWVLLVQYFVAANRRTEHQKVDTDLITRIYFGCLNACIRRLKRLWGVCSGEGQMKQALIAEDCDQEVKNFWVTKSALRSSRCVHDQSSRNCLLSSISLDTTTEYQNRFRLKMHWNDHTAHHHTKSSNQSLWLGRVCVKSLKICVPSWRLQICRWFILAGRNLEERSAGIVRLKLMYHTIYDGRQGGWIIRPMPTPQVLQGNFFRQILLCKASSWRFSCNQEAPSCAVKLVHILFIVYYIMYNWRMSILIAESVLTFQWLCLNWWKLEAFGGRHVPTLTA